MCRSVVCLSLPLPFTAFPPPSHDTIYCLVCVRILVRVRVLAHAFVFVCACVCACECLRAWIRVRLCARLRSSLLVTIRQVYDWPPRTATTQVVWLRKPGVIFAKPDPPPRGSSSNFNKASVVRRSVQTIRNAFSVYVINWLSKQRRNKKRNRVWGKDTSMETCWEGCYNSRVDMADCTTFQRVHLQSLFGPEVYDCPRRDGQVALSLVQSYSMRRALNLPFIAPPSEWESAEYLDKPMSSNEPHYLQWRHLVYHHWCILIKNSKWTAGEAI